MASIRKIRGHYYARFRATKKDRLLSLDASTLREAQKKLPELVKTERGDVTIDDLIVRAAVRLGADITPNDNPRQVLLRVLASKESPETLASLTSIRFKDMERAAVGNAVKLGRLRESRKSWARTLSGETPNSIRLDAAWAAWMSAPKRSEPSQVTLNGMYKPIWQRFQLWGESRQREHLHEISAADALDHMAYLKEKEFSARSIGAARSFLSSVWSALAVQGGLDNVWATTPRPTLGKSRRDSLTVEELQRLFNAAADAEERALLGLGLFCGMRLGDAACLSLSAVDVSRGLISFRPSKTHRYATEVKIPIHKDLGTLLAAVKRGQKEVWTLPKIAREYNESRSSVSDRIAAIFDKAGIATKLKSADGGRRRAESLGAFHRLRHSFVTYASKAGVPPSTIRAMTGHTTAEIQRLYEHTDEAELRRAVAAFPADWEALAPKSGKSARGRRKGARKS